MPGVVQPGIVGSREMLSDLIFEYDAEETPYLSMVPKLGPPTSEIAQWQAKAPSKVNKRGVRDGTPLDSTKKHSDRGIIETNTHWFRTGVSVGKKAELINNVAGIADQYADEVLNALSAIKVGADQILCDDTDQRDEGADGSETRGLGSYISASAQEVRPVPEKFRTGSGQIWSSGALTAFQETDLSTLAAAMYSVCGKSQTLTGILGIWLKQHVSDFSYVAKNVDGKTFVRQFNQDVSDYRLHSKVDVVECDGATFELHLSRNLGISRDGWDQTDASKMRGYLLQLDACGVMTGQEPMHTELAQDGGGRRGQVDMLLAHAVTPKLCGKIVPTSAT